MPAAASKARIKAPVGVDPRPAFSQGGKVRNAPADVMVVQRLLAAAGQKAEVNGRVNAALLKAISTFQKANGFRNPDGVVDPGGRTFKALVRKAASGKGPGVEVEVLQIVVRGRPHPVTPRDFDRAVAGICRKLGPVHRAMMSQYRTIDDTAQFYIDAATGASGFMDALVMWSSSLSAGLKPPGFSHGGSALVMLRRVERAISSGDLRKAVAAMPAAQTELNAYAREVKAYGDRFAGGAKDMQERLELARDTSFEIASFIAAGYMAARGRASPVQAKAAAGALFGMIKSASTQYGRSLAGYSDSALESAGVIMFDTIAAGAKGGLSAKYIDKLGISLAGRLIKDPPFSYIGTTGIQNIYRLWVKGAGKQAVNELFDSVLAIVTDAGKTRAIRGRSFDWGKALEKKMVDGLFKVATAGFLGNVSSAQNRLGAALTRNARVAAADTAMLKKLRLDKNGWFAAQPIREQYKLMKGVIESLSGNIGNDALKSAWGGVAGRLKGTESAQAIADALAREVMASKPFLKAMERKLAELERKRAGKARGRTGRQ